MLGLNKKNFANEDQIKTAEEIITVVNAFNLAIIRNPNYKKIDHLDILLKRPEVDFSIFKDEVWEKLETVKLAPFLKNYLALQYITLQRDWLNKELLNIRRALPFIKIENLEEKQKIETTRRLIKISEKIAEYEKTIEAAIGEAAKVAYAMPADSKYNSAAAGEKTDYKNMQDTLNLVRNELKVKMVLLKDFVLENQVVREELNFVEKRPAELMNKSKKLVFLINKIKTPEDLEELKDKIDELIKEYDKDINLRIFNEFKKYFSNLLLEAVPANSRKDSPLITKEERLKQLAKAGAIISLQVEHIIMLVENKNQELQKWSSTRNLKAQFSLGNLGLHLKKFKGLLEELSAEI